MPKLRPILPALALAISAATLVAPANAQLTPLQDPANLAGERVSPQDPADTLPLNHGAPALQQLLAKLRTRASLMLIVAHPDDEDGGLLTYESRGQGARVAMLTLTRGEGGQNLMSADFDDALGLIRTQELLAADRYFGVDQFFGTEVDFGFSKTKEESFQKWTHDRVLYDAVRAVRLYRPLVIASVFVGGPTDGHGQHQVAGEIAQEVFVAAADPNVFPEMIAEGLLPWAPLKVYARVPFSRVTPEGMYDYATGRIVPTRFHNYVTGEDSTAVPTATVLIHEGDKPTDTTLAAAMGGDTFLQFARKGLALQKTQIGPNARLAAPGAFDAPYTLMASRLGCINTKSGCPILSDSGKGGFSTTKPTTEQSLFDGIDTSLPGVASLAPDAPQADRVTLEAIDKQIAEAQQFLKAKHLEATARPVTDALKSLIVLCDRIAQSTLPNNQKAAILHELHIEEAQLEKALILAHELTYRATLIAPKQLLSDSETLVISYTVENDGPNAIRDLSQRYLAVAGSNRIATSTHLGGVDPHATRELNQTLASRTHLTVTRPYFSRQNFEQAFYDISETDLRNAPSTPSPVETSILARTGETIGSGFLGMKLMPSVTNIGEPKQAVSIVPAISVSISPALGIFGPHQQSLLLTAHVQTQSSIPQEGTLKLEIPSGWQVTPTAASWTLSQANPTSAVSFKLVPPPMANGTTAVITAVASSSNQTYTESFRPVGYPGLPYTNFYTPATTRITAVDLHTAPNLRVAYLTGTGDPVPDFLPNLGITPTLLTLKDLTPATLNRFDAVLLGVRAYAALPALAGPGSQPLLDYAKQGGVVIVQYNTARFGDAEAPYPIDVPGDSAHNVVEEAQPVTLLHPEAPLLTWPNRLTAADFNGWVAERGHGFAASWSPQYQPLLETHDAGQDPQQGGLLLARTGKGAYIYCALALYRQLPEGVPGAYRLLANLLSYAKNPAFAK